MKRRVFVTILLIIMASGALTISMTFQQNYEYLAALLMLSMIGNVKTDTPPINNTIIGSADAKDHAKISTSLLISKFTNQTVGIIVVPYFESTSSDWNTIYQQADNYPGTIRYVIINPCSGPCAEPLSYEWQEIIYKLKTRGIKTLGYIFDNAHSIENIDYYMKVPDVTTDGIFFDNEGNIDNLTIFKKYADYVHSLNGIVYINPGFYHPHVTNYLTSGAADVANLYEFEYTNFHHIAVNSDIPPDRMSVILGNLSTESEMKKVLSETAAEGIGIVYLYAYSYDSLPQFFSQQIQEASITKIKNKSNPFPVITVED